MAETVKGSHVYNSLREPLPLPQTFAETDPAFLTNLIAVDNLGEQSAATEEQQRLAQLLAEDAEARRAVPQR